MSVRVQGALDYFGSALVVAQHDRVEGKRQRKEHRLAQDGVGLGNQVFVANLAVAAATPGAIPLLRTLNGELPIHS